jgi:hypothetical protein
MGFFGSMGTHVSVLSNGKERMKNGLEMHAGDAIQYGSMEKSPRTC